MKTTKSRKHQSASVLLVTLFITILLAISIAGYLSYIEQQATLGARSQSWNLALTIAESGVEEALAHLNYNYSNLNQWPWTAEGNTYTMSRWMTNGSYTVTIDNSNPNAPIILSRGFVTAGMLVRNNPGSMFATVGLESDGPDQINRAVRVVAARSGLFLASMVAKRKIDLNGNGVTSDSFDSGDPTKSTNGRYDPNKAQDNGDVASNDSIVSAVSVQNANIYGRVFTGPNGTATIGSQGAVGTHAWQATHTGFQPGYVLNNANFTFPDTTFPFTTGSAPPSGYVVTMSSISTNGVTYTTNNPPPPPSSGWMGPIMTNYSVVTTTVLPSPIPAGLSTNTTYVTVAANPDPKPAGTVTNFLTAGVSSLTYPSPGTYVGSITTNEVTSGPKSGRGTWYIYASITGIASYTYPGISYSYPNYTYTYTVYATTPTYSTNYYDNIIGNGDYYATSISGQTIVTGRGRLVLKYGLNMSGNDTITVAPGGSLMLYSGGTSFTIGGNGVINGTGFAENFITYCANSVTSFTLNGNGEFTGVLVAPNANLAMNGGGNSVQDFSGALMANSVTMNGHFKFHYDEALGRKKDIGRFLISSWNEVD